MKQVEHFADISLSQRCYMFFFASLYTLVHLMNVMRAHNDTM